MKRELTIATGFWLALTALGEALAMFADFYPVARADKGEDIERAFRVLVYFAVPVLALVVSVLLYSVLRHRATELPQEEGPALYGRGPVPVAWFAITAGLTLAIMIYPGLVGIPEIFDEEAEPDLIVEVVGLQWAWLVSYPQYNITGPREIVLPVGRTVQFQITSQDVLHSFWIPGFLMKIDAVPGRTTTMSLRPTKTGSFQTDPNLRVQCAELCGLFHAKMHMPVRVVSEGEFESWVQEQAEVTAPGPAETPVAAPNAQRFTIVGRNLQFDTREIVVEANRQVAITFDNQEDGMPHNWALYESEEAARSKTDPIAASSLERGPVVQQIVFDAPGPGSYYFVCDVHSNMNGEFVVK